MTTLQATSAASAPARPHFYAAVERDLEEVESVLARTLQSPRPFVQQLLQHLRSYAGKRLRPALLLLTARACGRVTSEHHILAAVVEMIHTATLVHDDVLDGAAMRRHVSTVNAGWGNQNSILLGDFLFTHAFHLASSVDAQACRIIGEATNRVCEGELQQSSQRGNLDLDEEEYLDIIDGKTAELTACCCRLGALYSGSSDEVVEALTRYGRSLGVAFQIADDLLDLIGEERATGKSLGTDLDQQKVTLPIIRLLTRAPVEAATRLRQVLCSPGNHKREALRSFFVESDALAYARSRAEQFATQAQAELVCLSPSPCRTILANLTEQVVHRST
jgi:octaprenyl-diphosphate synthase